MNLSHKSMEILKKHGFNIALQLFKDSEIIQNKVIDIGETDFILQAKKVILEEQYDKLSNMQLGQIDSNDLVCEEIYKKEEAFDFQNDSMKKLGNFNCTGQLEIITKPNINSKSTLLSKYFLKWKNCTKNTSCKLENNSFVERKLNTLIQAMNEKRQKPESSKTTSTKKIIVDIEKHRKSSPSFRTARTSIYVNRYNAQKDIIQQQKEKLEQQERLIEELKFNKIKQDIEKSVEQSKYEIHNIFKKCSTKVKCNIGKIIEKSNSETSNSLEDSSDENLKSILNLAKVPKMVREMEKRAMERELNRQIIRERKRIIDEKRKKMAEDFIEKKQLLDEEQTKKNMEIMKEKRRNEIEKEKLRKKNKEVFLANCKRVDKFYERKVIRIYFDNWVRLITIKKFNETKAECYNDRKLQNKCFSSLLQNSRDITEYKNKQSVNLYNYKLKKYCIYKFKFILLEKRRNFQVAEDYYDMKLEERIFIQWHRNVCHIQMAELKFIRKAEMHYLHKIRFHYFHQWRTLSAVLLLEKAKEEKRMKWRRKVLEVLPDYQLPPDD